MYKLLQAQETSAYSPTYSQLRNDCMMPLLMASAIHTAKSTCFLTNSLQNKADFVKNQFSGDYL